jgi:hypothetical protein
MGNSEGCFPSSILTGHRDIEELERYVAAVNEKAVAQDAIAKLHGAANH